MSFLERETAEKYQLVKFAKDSIKICAESFRQEVNIHIMTVINYSASGAILDSKGIFDN